MARMPIVRGPIEFGQELLRAREACAREARRDEARRVMQVMDDVDEYMRHDASIVRHARRAPHKRPSMSL
jgi:hypothetical protein